MNPHRLTLTEFSGSPFHIGLAMGQFGAAAVHRHLIRSEIWDTVMQWRTTPVSQAMQDSVKALQPYIHDELQGLAKGLELPFEDVFLWNCRGDLNAMTPDGCTTVLQITDHGPRISHNEDGDPGFDGDCAIATFEVDGGVSFASFIYPGSIPGHTVAVTRHGLAMTVNNIRSTQAQPGLPRMVLMRALLSAPDLSAAVELLRQSARSGGFHVAMSQRGGSALLSVEFTRDEVSVLPVKTPVLHANHLVHPQMAPQPQRITASSDQRQLRGDRLLATAGESPVDALTILADQAQEEPVYRRSASDTDNENTLATFDIRIGADHIAWDVYEHPLQPPRFQMIDTRAV